MRLLPPTEGSTQSARWVACVGDAAGRERIEIQAGRTAPCRNEVTVDVEDHSGWVTDVDVHSVVGAGGNYRGVGLDPSVRELRVETKGWASPLGQIAEITETDTFGTAVTLSE